MKNKYSSKACGCCEGVDILTPQATANRPGLDALAYRVGTHASFLETMQARLSSLPLSLPPPDEGGQEQTVYPLAGLTTRDKNDPAIALLDAGATMLDVLTFYQERIANEGYLGTATERRSILELARLVGYKLRPGVAASVYLAFTLEESHEAPTQIPAGTRAQSVPAPGETSQSFETAEPFEARSVWNQLQPRLTRPQRITSATRTLYLQGTKTGLEPNSPILIDFGYKQVPYRVTAVEPNPKANHTKVTFHEWVAAPQTAREGKESVTLAYRYRRALPKSLKAEALRTFVADLSEASDYQPPDWEQMARQMAQALLDAFAALADAPSSPARDQAVQETIQVLQAVKKALDALIDRLPATSLAHQQVEEMRRWVVAALNALQSESEGAPEDPLEGASLLNEFTKKLTFVPPASIPLSHATKLRLDPAVSFGRQSDIRPQLYVNLRGVQAKMLYRAISNVNIPVRQPKVYALRVAASLFGHNAPLQPLEFDTETGDIKKADEWDIDETDDVVYLDASYDKILPGSWLVVEPDNSFNVDVGFLIVKAQNPKAGISRGAYGTNAKTTRIELAVPANQKPILEWSSVTDFDAIRRTRVYAQSEKLALADEPIDPILEPVADRQIDLDGVYNSLKPGRWLIVSGERTDLDGIGGVQNSELVLLTGVELNGEAGGRPYNSLILDNQLAYQYKRDTVTIYANVIKATHGETQKETLGSGDGAKARQLFELKKAPLTFLAAPTPAGAASTLEVRVNDIAWRENDNLFTLQPGDRAFITRTDNEDKTSVIFGDGRNGARLPSGSENVKAVYRQGIGKPGNVAAEQIKLLATKPLGVKGVINPLPASGGADRENRDQARANAPLAVMALDRLVSVQDYADFARTFAGIGKASAISLPNGRRRVVHLTIAGADDIPIAPTSDVYQNLRLALQRAGDPYQPFVIVTRELMALVIRANVRLHPAYQWESVKPALETALYDAFGFERRQLGQDVLLSEVISVMQRVDGVVYVDVDVLDTITESETEDEEALNAKLDRLAGTSGIRLITSAARKPPEKQPHQRIPVQMGRFENGAPKGAQLAILNPDLPQMLDLKELPQ